MWFLLSCLDKRRKNLLLLGNHSSTCNHSKVQTVHLLCQVSIIQSCSQNSSTERDSVHTICGPLDIDRHVKKDACDLKAPFREILHAAGTSHQVIIVRSCLLHFPFSSLIYKLCECFYPHPGAVSSSNPILLILFFCLMLLYSC